MDLADVSYLAQDYLKHVWNAQEWSTDPVTVSQLAKRMRVSPSTASEAVSKLVDQGLLAHEKYGSVELTEQGSRVALGMVRRHRLLETFLVRLLGYTWDEVHDEAELLEHAVSDTMISRIDESLGRPRHDPHGDPIPTADGSIASVLHPALADLAEGERCTVMRISDTDPQILRFLAGHGIDIDRQLDVVRHLAVVDQVVVRAPGSDEEVSLSTRVAGLILVSRARAD